MICKNCGNEMELDDYDFHFKGCKDNYWTCYPCNLIAIEKIRYGKQIKIEWDEAIKTVN